MIIVIIIINIIIVDKWVKNKKKKTSEKGCKNKKDWKERKHKKNHHVMYCSLYFFSFWLKKGRKEVIEMRGNVHLAIFLAINQRSP